MSQSLRLFAAYCWPAQRLAVELKLVCPQLDLVPSCRGVSRSHLWSHDSPSRVVQVASSFDALLRPDIQHNLKLDRPRCQLVSERRATVGLAAGQQIALDPLGVDSPSHEGGMLEDLNLKRSRGGDAFDP